MTSDRWAEVERLYEAARELRGEQRLAYLADSCGSDRALKAEVESFLAYDSDAEHFLEAAPPPDPARQSSPASPHPFTWVVWLATIATIASFLYAAWLLPTPVPGFGWTATERAGAWYVGTARPGGPAGTLRPRDRLISLNGDSGVERGGPAAHRGRLNAGDAYTLVVERDGQRQSHVLQVRSAPRDLPYELFWYFMSLVWCATGLFIGFVRPGHPAARLACLSSVAVGLLFLHATIVRGGPLWAPLHVVLGYHFFLLFPTGRPPGRFWVAALWSMYGSAAAAIVIRYGRFLTNMVYGPEAATALAAAYPRVFGVAELLSLYAYSAALVLMVAVIPWNYRKLTDADQRRRVRWMALGSAVAIAGQLWWAAGLVLEYIGSPIDIAPVDLSAAAITIPIAVAYAVVRHRVFDVRVVIRRGLQHLLAKRALQALIAIPAAAVVIVAITNRHLTLAELAGTNRAYLLWGGAAGLALVFRRPVALWLDRRFFREEYDREQVLFGLFDDLKSADSAAALSSLVAGRLQLALHPKVLQFWYGEAGSLTLDYSSNPDIDRREFPAAGQLAALLRRESSAVDVAAALPSVTRREAAWLTGLGATLLIPVTDRSDHLDGVWLLGERKSETPYTPGDRRLLEAIARQTAVARENLRLRARVTEDERIRRDVLSRLDRDAFNLLKECPACGTCFDNSVEHCGLDGHPLTTPLPVERTIDKRYRLDRLIGRGGMGAVYEAHDNQLRRQVAVKIILGRAFGQPAALRRFEREARTAASLSHPNIVNVFDFGRLEGEGAYLVMERLSGTTLREVLEQHGPLSPRDAAAWFEPLLDGLEAAHAAGIVHRDLKPENVLRHERAGQSASVKILDFGLAKLRDTEAVATTTLTAGGFVVGTLGYMSPEHRHGGPVDHRADIFAIGVMVAEALTSVKPSSAAGAGVFGVFLDEAYELPHLTAEGRTLSRLVARCLHRAPEERPASASALKHDLIPALLACQRL